MIEDTLLVAGIFTLIYSALIYRLYPKEIRAGLSALRIKVVRIAHVS